jgi:tetratricopeptide (TPR) repeat protein
MPGDWSEYPVNGMWLLGQGKIAAAIDLHRRRIEEFPVEARAHVGLANALAQNRDFAEAIEEYRIAIGLNPKVGRLSLGLVLYRSGNAEEALNEFKTSMDLNPEFLNPLLEIAKIYRDQSRIEEATNILQAMITPRCYLTPDALMALSDIHIEQGELEEVIPLLQELVKLRPKMRGAYLKLGNVLDAVGLHDQARIAWKKVLEIQSILPGHESQSMKEIVEEAKKALQATE